MNVAKRRTKPAEERRANLLDAAEQLVLTQGADGFTIDDVTNGAGVAKGTFYLHFTNKGDLLDGLRERYMRQFAAHQLAEARKHQGITGIQAWMRAGIDVYLRDIRLHDVLFHPTARGERDVPNSVIDGLTVLLSELDRPPADPHVAATILYAAMHGVTDHIVHTPDESARMLAGLDELILSFLTP